MREERDVNILPLSSDPRNDVDNSLSAMRIQKLSNSHGTNMLFSEGYYLHYAIRDTIRFVM